MVSFRRAISVAQDDEVMQNAETFSIPSSPSKLSHNQNPLPTGTLLTGLSCSLDLLAFFHRVRMLAFCSCSRRSFRSMERTSKSKGHGWKRSFVHLLVSFILGAFVGLAPLFSMEFSEHFMHEHQAFFLDITPPSGNVHNYFSMPTYMPPLLDNEFEQNASVGMIQEFNDDISNAFYRPSWTNDSTMMHRKLLIIVTAIHARPFQVYHLNRLAYTLKLVPPPLLWIVVEMSFQSPETAEILRKTGVMYRHLVCQTKMTRNKYRSIHLRNVALSHIEKHHLDGIVYFADVYSVYTVELFEQIRIIRRFGTWPIAKLMENKNKVILEGPVCNDSKVIGWHTNERSKETRRFHVSMSGFAFNSSILWDPKSFHRPTPEHIRQLDTIKEEFQDSSFVEQLVEDESQMEAIPKGCSKIMVWNIHLKAPHLHHSKIR